MNEQEKLIVSDIISDMKTILNKQRINYQNDIKNFGNDAYKFWKVLNYDGGLHIVPATDNLDVELATFIYRN